jgi:hypothetical protein
MIGEGAVNRNLFELAVGVLVGRVDPDIAEALAGHRLS